MSERTEEPDVVHLPSAIAIIGMAGRFPGARTLAEFRRNLEQGVESITRFSDDELIRAGVDRRLLADPDYVKAAPLLEDADRVRRRLLRVLAPRSDHHGSRSSGCSSSARGKPSRTPVMPATPTAARPACSLAAAGS
jgi:hypothetical protein